MAGTFIDKPNITDFTNSQHAHSGASSGGTIANITGNAATVSNATLTTALTVNGGTLTLTANVANSSVLTIGAGAVSVSGSNTGDQTNISGNAATVTGLSVTAGKTLTVSKTMTLTAADDTGSYTLPTGTKTLLATDGSAASLTSFPTLNQNTSGTAAGLSATLVPASGGTGVANNNASTITISGNFATTLTVSNTTTLTLPTTGTVATLAGAEVLTNKTLTTPVIRSWDGWEDANESWTYSSADGDTGVITIPSDGTTKYAVGMRIKLTQTTVKYFIITAISATTMTVFGGTDYTLANAAISANFYSPMKAPLGFPLSTDKWKVEYTNATEILNQASPTNGTWYNAFSLSLPIGVWNVSYQILLYALTTSAVDTLVNATLSTANNTQSDSKWSSSLRDTVNGTLWASFSRRGTITLAARTTYYLNGMSEISSISQLNIDGRHGDLILTAISAYL